MPFAKSRNKLSKSATPDATTAESTAADISFTAEEASLARAAVLYKRQLEQQETRGSRADSLTSSNWGDLEEPKEERPPSKSGVSLFEGEQGLRNSFKSRQPFANTPSVASSLPIHAPGNTHYVKESIHLDFEYSESSGENLKAKLLGSKRLLLFAVVTVLLVIIVVIAVTAAANESENQLKICDEAALLNGKKIISETPLSNDTEFPDSLALNITDVISCIPEGAFDARNDLGSVDIIRFAGNGIKEINSENIFPVEFSPVVTLLEMKDSPELGSIPPKMLYPLQTLFEVRLTGLGISQLDRSMFSNTINLGLLFIENCKNLKSVPVFDNVDTLLQFGLVDNVNIEVADDNIFENMTKLTLFDATNTKLGASGECVDDFRTRTGLPVSTTIFGFVDCP